MTRLKVVAPAYVAARLVVLGSLWLAHLLVSWLGLKNPAVLARVHQGLLGWDAAYYAAIAAHGYAAAGPGALRFFPLTPVLARVVSGFPAVDPGAALLIVANVASFGACLLVHRLVLRETGDEAAARRAVWLLCLFPASFVLVMGYAEPLFLVTSIWAFLALRTCRPRQAALAGFLAGLTRPAGALLAIPAAIEMGRGWRGCTPRERVRRLLAVVGPPLGEASYLGWCQLTGRGFLTPLRDQMASNLRGGFADPFVTLWQDTRLLVSGSHLGTASHLPWTIVLVALLVVVFRCLPSSYGWYGAATLAVALSSANLDSLERYALGGLVFVLALVLLTESGAVYRTVLALSSAGLAAYAVLAFLNAYVP